MWAFGSRVHLRQLKTFSDLDLVVFTQQGQLLDLGVLRENLADSDLPFTVDVSSWAQLPDWLQQEILQEHVILQASKQLPLPPFAEQQVFWSDLDLVQERLQVCSIL